MRIDSRKRKFIISFQFIGFWKYIKSKNIKAISKILITIMNSLRKIIFWVVGRGALLFLYKFFCFTVFSACVKIYVFTYRRIFQAFQPNDMEKTCIKDSKIFEIFCWIFLWNTVSFDKVFQKNDCNFYKYLFTQSFLNYSIEKFRIDISYCEGSPKIKVVDEGFQNQYWRSTQPIQYWSNTFSLQLKWSQKTDC